MAFLEKREKPLAIQHGEVNDVKDPKKFICQGSLPLFIVLVERKKEELLCINLWVEKGDTYTQQKFQNSLKEYKETSFPNCIDDK